MSKYKPEHSRKHYDKHRRFHVTCEEAEFITMIMALKDSSSCIYNNDSYRLGSNGTLWRCINGEWGIAYE